MSDPKLIVLTGASRGLGRALTERFVASGHRVCGCCRSEAAAKDLRRQFSSDDFAAVDVADDEAVKRWAQDVVATHGAPDLLLNNAALMNQNNATWEVPVDEFQQLMAVNVNGVFHVLRHFVPPMIQRRTGVIVNFSSGWGRSTSPEVGPYCASKWAIEGLTRALAQELPHGMAAVPLNPGIIHTEMLESCFGPGAASYPSPSEWANNAAPFLLDLSYADNGDPLTAPS